MRERLAQAIEAHDLDDPARAVATALSEFERLPSDDELPGPEAEAARLIDALHPAASPGPSRPRSRCWLAAEVAAVLPRPANAPAPVDLDAMAALFGDRLTAGQRRFMRRLRYFLGSD